MILQNDDDDVAKLNSKFVCTPYRGDLNNLTAVGVYSIQSDCSNTPADSITLYGGMMLVLPYEDGTTSFQILASTTGRAWYVRRSHMEWQTVSVSTSTSP